MSGGTRLSEICTRITDGTHYSPKDEGEGRAFISVKDMGDAGIDFEGCFHIGEAAFAQVKASGSVPVAGDILFSKDGTVGKVAVVPEGAEFGVLSSIAILQPDHEVVDSRYLAQVLKSPDTLADALGRKTGSALRRLILKDLKGIRVPLPPLEEQRRIAHLLDEADRLQRLRKEANEKAKRILPALFVEMFGDPETNPKGWEVKSLGELVKVKSGDFLPAKAMSPQGGFPVYGGNGVSGYHDEFMFSESTIVVGRVGQACGAVHHAPPCSWVTDNALCVVEKSADLNESYLVDALTAARLRQYAAHADLPSLSGARLAPVPILVPPADVQERYASLRSDVLAVVARQKTASERLADGVGVARSRLFAETI